MNHSPNGPRSSRPSDAPATDKDLLDSAIPIDTGEDDEGDADWDEQDLAAFEAVEFETASVGLTGAGGGDAGEAGPRVAASSYIRAFGPSRRHAEHWKRTPNATGQGAIHVKTFVAKLRPDGMEFLDQQINEWLDDHPEYEVKFVTTATGQLMSKNPEPALILNVWV